jgi:ketosteroid isomerase-like protein
MTMEAQDRALIEQALREAAAGVEAGDVEQLMAMFDQGEEVFLFDYYPPRSVTSTELRRNFVASLETIDGAMTCFYEEIHPQLLSEDAAWSWAIMRVAFRTKDGAAVDLVVRVTDIWRKTDGRWRAIHEHASFPVDISTGAADLQSEAGAES